MKYMTNRSVIYATGLIALALLACKKEETGGAGAAASAAPTTSASAAPKASFEELAAKSQPLVLTPVAQSVGGKKVEAVQCKLPGAGLLAPSSSSVIRAIESVGDRMLIADHDGVIHGFKVSSSFERLFHAEVCLCL